MVVTETVFAETSTTPVASGAANSDDTSGKQIPDAAQNGEGASAHRKGTASAETTGQDGKIIAIASSLVRPILEERH